MCIYSVPFADLEESVLGSIYTFPRKVKRYNANIFRRNIVKLPKRQSPRAYTSYKERKNRKKYKIKS